MIRYRWARLEDVADLLNLIESGFGVRADGVKDRLNGNEHRILFTYLYSAHSWRPEWVWVGEAAGRLVSAVGFFPQQLNLGKVVVPVWAVSPVVTHPDYRGAGVGGHCLLQALEKLQERGISAVFLWGIPDFYPRYGFVPILPRYKTRLRKEQLKKRVIEIKGDFRTVQATDLTRLAAIYNQGNAEFWLQPQRTLEWWRARFSEMDSDNAQLKEVPYPVKENFKVWENSKGEVVGYLYFQTDTVKQQIEITEAAVTHYTAAPQLLKSFIDRLVPDGYDLIIRGTPQHHLNMAGYWWGGTHLNPAPLAGMIKVIDWPVFLRQVAGVFEERRNLLVFNNQKLMIPFQSGTTGLLLGITAAGLEVTKLTRNVEALGATQLTRLFFGLFDRDDWALLNWDPAEVERVFPSRYPFVWDANYLY